MWKGIKNWRKILWARGFTKKRVRDTAKFLIRLHKDYGNY